MSDRSLQINKQELQFLIAVCCEEIERCDKEQQDMVILEESLLSQKRQRVAGKLAVKMANVLETIYEDDGLESRPDLN